MKALLIATASLLLMAGCKSHTPQNQDMATVTNSRHSQRIIGGSSAFMPKARIYKTNGNYRDNVPIILTADGKGIVTYPAPTDIDPSRLPVQLNDGYLLDTRGIGGNTVFTTYTYEQYSALPEPPSAEELMKSIIPGARITEIRQVPTMTTSQAEADIPALNHLIATDLKALPVIEP